LSLIHWHAPAARLSPQPLGILSDYFKDFHLQISVATVFVAHSPIPVLPTCGKGQQELEPEKTRYNAFKMFFKTELLGKISGPY